MLNGQVAIVTGASRGIGEGILQVLAKAGATVIGTSTSQAGAEGITKALADAGAKGAGKVLDVRDSAACAPCLCPAVAAIQPGRDLVNNAGITKRQPARPHEGRGVGRRAGAT
jgi:3-oxoacyl-[acyl-carrier protein] reductase